MEYISIEFLISYLIEGIKFVVLFVGFLISSVAEGIKSAFYFIGNNRDSMRSLRDLSIIIFGLVGLWFLRRRTVALEKTSSAAEEQANAAEEQAKESKKRTRLTEKEQESESYIKAIEQLSSESLTIRIGGIYSLEKISTVSRDLFPVVFEVLNAFVREKTKIALATNFLEPAADIQAVIKVIGRREPKNWDDFNIDLSDCCLTDYSFEGSFDLVDFSGANLRKSFFANSSLHGANFRKADCKNAIFVNADCTQANFTDADCSSCFFRHADFEDADFKDANLDSADFTGAKNIGNEEAMFEGANLENTTF